MPAGRSPEVGGEMDEDECVCIPRFLEELGGIEVEVTEEDMREYMTDLFWDLMQRELFETFTVILGKGEKRE